MKPQYAQQQKTHSIRFNAMTLTELLVVMAIIAVLMALGFPLLARAVHTSQRTSCLNSMHQTSLAVNLYIQDYNETFPSFLTDPQSVQHAANPVYWHDRFCQGNFLQKGQPNWTTLTQPYAKGEIFVCPNDKRRNRPNTSYEYKMWLAEGRNEAEIPSIAQMAMLWEQWSFHQTEVHSEHDRRSRLNLAFVDGHVEPVDLDRTTSARYGTGPDLHWFFVGDTGAMGLAGKDVSE